ncbi:OLC1v1022281C2 [Oldenlandia corymbosa var. corymbosa]|uniref:OLC1v1022281C2 n=1 Tax=Oldenlandia corymbosa var. corymbosa TaxID=529605 RepID=A0AAV1BZS0_OLDCO|nr:OLC1v1022281C2 [Oldenlandia corymbosa var. corymbosa]
MVIKTGGNSYVSSPPSFSNDAGKLLVCTGNTVSIFSTSTGLLMGELEGHTALVTSVTVVPAASPAKRMLCNCWTSSLDGTIKYWDFSSAPELVKTIPVGYPIYYTVIPGILCAPVDDGEKPHDMFAYIMTEDVSRYAGQHNSTYYQIRKVNLTQCRLSGGLILIETSKPLPIAVSPTGKYIGVCEKQTLHIWKIPRRDADRASLNRVKLHHTKKLTTLAFHPTEQIVAAGDVSGRILIWRGVGRKKFTSSNDKLSNGILSMKDSEERPGVRGKDDADSCTTWHWHSAQVNLLFFSTDGAYLYSGGQEGVLVLWQLDTGKKKFLPRIGSPLRYYVSSSDPSLSSVSKSSQLLDHVWIVQHSLSKILQISCADNIIHLLQMPSMEILRSIAGIKPPNSVLETTGRPGCPVVVNHSNALAAVCTESYSIQLYSLLNDREISEVRVCERNHQPGDEITVVVNLVALSLDGSTMGTVETRLPEEGIGGLVSLKFWDSISHSKEFSLSTVVYEPHREAGVSGMAFHPTRRMAVSSSYGADFKVWVCGSEVSQKDQKNGWTCHAVGSYKNKPMTAVTFSADGSVLAVAAGNVITLWDPEKNFLVAVIGESTEPITSLSFVGKSEYLVSASCGSKPKLFLWSMAKLSLSWSYNLQAEAVSCAMDDSLFAVLARLPSFESKEPIQAESKEPLEAENKEPLQPSLQGADGSILFFKLDKAVPVSAWFVKKAQGGTLAFVRGDSGFADGCAEGKLPEFLTYINGAHEYVLLDPFGGCDKILRRVDQADNRVDFEESTRGRYGYTSVYGSLPEFKLEAADQTMAIGGSDSRSWEKILDGPSHSLPPLTKLCSAFLESLLERRTPTVQP